MLLSAQHSQHHPRILYALAQSSSLLLLLQIIQPATAVQIDHDSYHKMLEEYRAAKQKQQGDELKIRQ